MKPSLRFLILAFSSCSSLGIAGDERALPAPDATARIPGSFPNGGRENITFKDITLNYWRIEKIASKGKGGAAR